MKIVRLFSLFPALVAAVLATAPLSAQTNSVLAGTVVHATSDEPIPGVILRITGTSASAVSDAEGHFVLRGLPVGPQTLEVQHPEYGEHSLAVSVSRSDEHFSVMVHLASDGMTVELLDADAAPSATAAPSIPVTVGDELGLQPVTGPAVAGGTVVDRERIRQLAASSRNVGDLIRRAVPTLQVRESEVVGNSLCLEFRGTSARSMNLARTSESCHDPAVYVDGIMLSDPTAGYAMTSMESVQWIQAIPPGQAGAQFGQSTYGVILIATTNAALRPDAQSAGSGMFVRSSRTSFDWEQDPNGHHFLRAFLGAAAGNAAGLAAGLAAGRHCVYVEDVTNEVATRCSRAGVAGVGLVAFALPAMGSALGAHIGGGSSVSVGRWIPALVGAGLALFPGYAYSLSTVGDGVRTSNAAGKAFLIVGTPLVTALADRLFRKLRAR